MLIIPSLRKQLAVSIIISFSQSFSLVKTQKVHLSVNLSDISAFFPIITNSIIQAINKEAPTLTITETLNPQEKKKLIS